MNRWTFKKIESFSDLDFAIEIMQERKMKLTNYYSPLYVKLSEVIANLRLFKSEKTLLKSNIKKLIKEHEEAGYCTNYDMAQGELEKDVSNAFDYAYDCGRYECLEEILRILEEKEQ